MALRVYQDAWRSRLTAEQRREAYVARLEASSGRFDAQPFQREQLLELMDADGLIARIGGAVSSQGVTEPEESLQPVIAALRSVASRGIASSDALRDLDDSAASYASRVSGALYIGLSESTGEYLLLSRRELPATVRWAGNYDPAPDAQGDCNPQASFVAWRKNMRGRARPWTDIELETARMVRKQFLHVRDAQKLRRLEDRFRYASTR
jgi:light-regulated signal transduction histidine kinase (bacteriophytochrome)